MKSLIPFGNKSRVGAELLDVFLNLLIEAGDERRDQHDHTDTENHAEYGKPTAHLVGTKRIHGLF